jgi:hypothetical protein
MLPADLSIVGTVHSHPSGALFPSEADLQLFRSWGRRHLIVGSPFGPGSWRAYDGNGAETHLDVVGPPAFGRGRLAAREYHPVPLHRPVSPATEPFPEDEA